MKTHLPSFEDLSPSHGLDLDEKSAAEHFLGKSQQEVFSLLKTNIFFYSEDFAYMGYIAFCYYLPAVLELVKYLYFDNDEFEETLDAVLFIAEMRRVKDKMHAIQYKKIMVDILKRCHMEITRLQQENHYECLNKRKKRWIRSRLQKIEVLQKAYL